MHDDETPMWEKNSTWRERTREMLIGEPVKNEGVAAAQALFGLGVTAKLQLFVSDLPSADVARVLATHKPSSLELEYAKITDAIRAEVIHGRDPKRKVTVTVHLSSTERDFVEQELVLRGYSVTWDSAPATLDVATSNHCTDHVITVWIPAVEQGTEDGAASS